MEKSDILKLGALVVFFYAVVGAVAVVPGASEAVVSGLKDLDNVGGSEKALDTRLVETKVHHDVNGWRQDRGLEQLERREALDRAARQHSRDLLEAGRLGHTGTDGSGPSERVQRQGVACSAGENVAETWFLRELTDGNGGRLQYNNESELATGVVASWMVSDGHRENILRGEYTTTGVGVAASAERGEAEVVVTQVFCS